MVENDYNKVLIWDQHEHELFYLVFVVPSL